MVQQHNTGATASIRVLFVNLPLVLTDYLTLILAREQDIVVVGSLQGYMSALLGARSNVDVLVLGAPSATPMPGVCSLLLSEFPRLRIIVVAAENEDAFGYYLALSRRELGSVSGETLVTHIRSLYNKDVTADPQG